MPQPVTLLPGLEHEMQTMPFDQFGRYHMLREAVDACRIVIGDVRLKILDVGGYFFNAEGQHSLPILPFLPNDDVLVIDVEDCELPNYIRGDGTKLDFGDGAFDLVVTADTLEHIPRPQREAFWNELLRVAKHGVILLAPFASAQVESAEQLLNQFIKTYLHSNHVMLNEHVQYGLPRLDEWLPWLNNAGFKAASYPTGYVHSWIAMMMMKHLLMRISPGAEAQYSIDGYYNRSFFPTERRNPAYRHMIFAQKTTGLLDAVDAAIAPTIFPDHEDAADWGQAVVPTLLSVIQAQLNTLSTDLTTNYAQHMQHLQEHYHMQHLQEHYIQHMQHLQEHIANLQHETSVTHRLLADQQIAFSELQKSYHENVNQHHKTQLDLLQQQAIKQDLLERSAWLEQQNNHLRRDIEAIQKGRVMQLLNIISRRK